MYLPADLCKLPAEQWELQHEILLLPSSGQEEFAHPPVKTTAPGPMLRSSATQKMLYELTIITTLWRNSEKGPQSIMIYSTTNKRIHFFVAISPHRNSIMLILRFEQAKTLTWHQLVLQKSWGTFERQKACDCQTLVLYDCVLSDKRKWRIAAHEVKITWERGQAHQVWGHQQPSILSCRSQCSCSSVIGQACNLAKLCSAHGHVASCLSHTCRARRASDLPGAAIATQSTSGAVQASSIYQNCGAVGASCL